MCETLPENEYEGNYQVPVSPFVNSILFCSTLVGHGEFSKFKMDPVTAEIENRYSICFKCSVVMKRLGTPGLDAQLTPWVACQVN